MKTQWERYKELELIPDSAPAPKASKFKIALPLVVGWFAAKRAGARASVQATHGVFRALLDIDL